ncbi:MAG: DUF421 domain-containing protein [Bacilli bacterium]|nr:DUF421 domain-containing protein [Bacilli bacterium]MDD3304934.1 DUF421 domain-containing protein [Bacilli bacterium]MDD4054149.1 DUF421 domain-containing protein [Bacilli bacterium]MDD4411849.1 DUF421 domain-containing protein [Bacilli bacterium]
MNILMVLLELVAIYILIIIVFRFMGKRKISDLSITDLIVFLILSNIISISNQINNESFTYIAITIFFLVGLQFLLTYIHPRLPTFKYMFESIPTTIISKGKLNYREMINRRYKLEDLLEELKQRNINSVETVEYAFLDNRGELSTFGYNKKDSDIPLPIILDGMVQYPSLKLLHKDDKWIDKIIKSENVTLNNIFYAFYQSGRLYIIKNEQ